MSYTNTTVLVTGANRGLGFAFIQTYLSRPNHTVIGTVRDIVAARAGGLENIAVAPGSRLILLKLESTSFDEPAEAIEDIAAQGINKLDVVIANAAVTGGEVLPITVGDSSAFLDTLAINVVAPAALFRATYKLLEAASEPKWVAISSSSGSISTIEPTYEAMGKPLGFMYGASKAALNFLGATIHVENPRVTSLIICPGLMNTDMGNQAVGYFGLDRAPHEPLDNVKSIVEIIDNAKRETHSGKFWSFEGKQVPW